MKTKLQHLAEMLDRRLESAPAERKAAKKLELSLAGILIGAGVGMGEALSIAELAARNPVSLAERLHRIGNEFLLSQSPPTEPVKS